jgi:hypothetical protein
VRENAESIAMVGGADDEVKGLGTRACQEFCVRAC